jgi:hypothetical protein
MDYSMGKKKQWPSSNFAAVAPGANPDEKAV